VFLYDAAISSEISALAPFFYVTGAPAGSFLFYHSAVALLASKLDRFFPQNSLEWFFLEGFSRGLPTGGTLLSAPPDPPNSGGTIFAFNPCLLRESPLVAPVRRERIFRHRFCHLVMTLSSALSRCFWTHVCVCNAVSFEGPRPLCSNPVDA